MIGELMKEMMEVNKGDCRRINHALKVYSHSKCIAELEGVDESTRNTIEIAAVLHDIGVKYCMEKYGQTGGNLQHQESPPIARKILEKYTSDKELIERVCYLIAHHHIYKDVKDIDHQIIIEAGLIVNAEEGNISPKAFKVTYERFFKTPTGKSIAELTGQL